jgi:DNA-binding PadR family transcriptional regulator
MKYKLTNIEQRVLYMVMAEMSPKNPEYYSEFPYLESDEINSSLNKLEKLGLIFFDKDINLYRETDEGSKLIDSMDEFDKIKEEFNKNSPHQ